MSEQVETETITLRPAGQGDDEIRQVSETEADPLSHYTVDGNKERLVYRPRTPDEANALRRGGADLRHRSLITWAGLTLIFIVTLAAVASFLGITFSHAPSAHEDAVRLLLLIIGAVLGAVFGATVLADNDRG